MDVGIWTSKERFEFRTGICELTVVLKATEMDEIIRESRERKVAGAPTCRDQEKETEAHRARGRGSQEGVT